MTSYMIMKYIKQITYAWAIIVYTALFWPMPNKIPNEAEFTMYDKVVHLLLFFILCYLIILLFYKVKKRFSWQILAKSAGLVVFYAIFLELLQEIVPGRDSDIIDFLAGTCGVSLAIFLGYVNLYKRKPRILLQICCIGCGAYVSNVLQEDYDLTLYFYNPNIYPKEEYDKRLAETKKIAEKIGLKLITADYGHGRWLEMVKDLEQEPEKGQRCKICYKDRLEQTAIMAKIKSMDYFASTLTVSPHKIAELVNELGKKVSKKVGVNYLEADFKKNEGFKKACKMSKDLNLYRQNYCGCEFSLRDGNKKKL